MKAAKRNDLRKTQFGLPGSRRFPMPDRAHAINAKARATQMENAGTLGSTSAGKVRAKADRVIARTKGKGK